MYEIVYQFSDGVKGYTNFAGRKYAIRMYDMLKNSLAVGESVELFNNGKLELSFERN